MPGDLEQVLLLPGNLEKVLLLPGNPEKVSLLPAVTLNKCSTLFSRLFGFMIIMFPRNQENLTIENLEIGDVEYETTVEISELRDNPAYTKYYTFLTR